MQKISSNKYVNGNLILKESETHGALVLGDCNSAIDKHIITPYKIRTIISIGKQAQPPQNKIPKQVNQKSYDIHDNKTQKIIDLLDQIYEVIQKGRLEGGVLVHCYAGVSRSSSFVIGYIMRKKYINYDDAKALVKKQRPCIYPNDGFVRQLQTYWKILVKRQQQKRKEFDQVDQKNESVTEEPLQTENASLITAKTIKGLRGAVRVAERSPSPQKNLRSLQKRNQQQKYVKFKVEEKMSQSLNLPQKKQAHMAEELLDLMPCCKQKKQQSKQQQKRKDIKGVYTNKTKAK